MLNILYSEDASDLDMFGKGMDACHSLFHILVQHVHMNDVIIPGPPPPPSTSPSTPPTTPPPPAPPRQAEKTREYLAAVQGAWCNYLCCSIGCGLTCEPRRL